MSAPKGPVDLALAPGSILNWEEGRGSSEVIIEDVLGKGGFGITYRARTRRYGTIALKEFFPRSMIVGRKGDEVQVERDKIDLFLECKEEFLRETRILRSLSSPYIVRVLFVIEQNNTAYYGMELLEGEDLNDYMKKLGRQLYPEEAYVLLHPIIEALRYLHANKVLHRDISPDNIFLHHEENRIVPCLVDFGAAFSAQKDFTHTFPRVKKRGYSPLEQNWDGEYQGTWSDVYSFMATFYYTITLRSPIPAEDRIIEGNDALKRPHILNPTVSYELEKVLMHGLALDYKKRIYNMKELDEELEKAFRTESHPTKNETEKQDLKPLIIKNRQEDQDSEPKESGVHGLLKRVIPSSVFEDRSPHKKGWFPKRKGSDNPFSGGKKGNSGKYHQLRCIEGYMEGYIIVLRSQTLRIGRNPDSDLKFPEEYRTVSGNHCMLFQDNGVWKVVDTKSKNGTWVNDIRLAPNEISPGLKPGDKIAFAAEVYIFE